MFEIYFIAGFELEQSITLILGSFKNSITKGKTPWI